MRQTVPLLEPSDLADCCSPVTGGLVSDETADLLAAHERAARLHGRVQHLDRRLSVTLGQRAWHASRHGAPAEVDAPGLWLARLEYEE